MADGSGFTAPLKSLCGVWGHGPKRLIIHATREEIRACAPGGDEAIHSVHRASSLLSTLHADGWVRLGDLPAPKKKKKSELIPRGWRPQYGEPGYPSGECRVLFKDGVRVAEGSTPPEQGPAWARRKF